MPIILKRDGIAASIQHHGSRDIGDHAPERAGFEGDRLAPIAPRCIKKPASVVSYAHMYEIEQTAPPNQGIMRV
jgi:hypothetical protein